MEPQENARQRKMEKAFAYIKSNMAGVILILLCIFFIIQDCFKMTRTGASLEEIVGSIAKNIIFGISISVLLRIQGLNDGKKSDEFRGSLKNYAASKTNIAENQDILPAYCNYKNETKLNDTKKQYLEENGFSYKKYIEGFYEKEEIIEKLTEEQKNILSRVNKVTIHRITPNELMYESSEFRKKPDYFNESKDRSSNEINYLSSSSIKDIISKVVLGVVFGCYALDPLINEDTLSGIIWSIFKLLVYLFFGFIAYMDAYNYTLNEYRHTHLIQKTYLLEECAVIIEKNPDLLHKYSDEEMVIKQFEIKEEKENDDSGRKEENTEC